MGVTGLTTCGSQMPSVHHLCPLRLHDLGEPRRLCQKGNGGTRGCGGSRRCDGAGDGPGPLGGRAAGLCAGGGAEHGNSVWVHVCVHGSCVCMCVMAYVDVHTCKHMQACTLACTHVYMRAHTRVRACVCVFV